MSTDWSKVLNDSIAAAKTKLGDTWQVAAKGATAQISNLVQTAHYIEDHKASMSKEESEFLASQQKVALQNVLTAYEAIGLAAAINALNAVVGVILAAVPGLLGFA